MKQKTKASAPDLEIGKNLRLLREAQGITQKQLAQASKISFQQIQKYELGQNRISAVRLCEFAKFFNVPADALLPEESRSREGAAAFEEHTNMIVLKKKMAQINALSGPDKKKD